MNDIIITPENTIYKYFIKYSRLSELMHYAFNGLNVDSINIYIDLYSIYHTIFSRSLRTNITNYVSFTSMIINMCAHYRSFFKNLGVSTKIFIVSSFNIPRDSIALVPEYNYVMVDKLKNKLVGDMVDLNVSLLELLCPYLPDIFFIKTDYESTVVMNEIMNRENPDQSIIISSDFYPTQLVALRPNVSYLFPLKGYNTDDSLVIPQNQHSQTFKDFWSVIARKFQNSLSFERIGSISPSNLMLLGALNRFPDRCFKTITNITKTTRLISQCYGFDSIKLTPQSLFDLIKPSEFKNIDQELLVNRYKTLDISYQSILYSQSIEFKTLHYENLEDSNAINMINNKYFANDPIDIFRL